jgi:large subunit ribosomal protein L15
MVAPVSLRTAKPNNNYPINEDPERLDLIYVRILGEGGDRLLTEEVKWLAVTHKSFDQGRRGFNDRLAFLGMRAPAVVAEGAVVIMMLT